MMGEPCLGLADRQIGRLDKTASGMEKKLMAKRVSRKREMTMVDDSMHPK